MSRRVALSAVACLILLSSQRPAPGQQVEANSAVSRADQIRMMAELNKARRAAQARRSAQNQAQQEARTQQILQDSRQVAAANAARAAENARAALANEQLRVQERRNLIEAEQVRQLQILNEIEGYRLYRRYFAGPIVPAR